MPIVDLAFRITGDSVPADHGYLLYSAVAAYLPALHNSNGEDEWSRVGIHPCAGTLTGNRELALRRTSRLIIRTPTELIGDFMVLAGRTLPLAGHNIHVGTPEVFPLKLSPNLHSRLVTIKTAESPAAFLEMARRQLDSLEIQGEIALKQTKQPAALEGNPARNRDTPVYIRRTLRIKEYEVVGYAVQVTGLTPEESRRLQEHGIGGRRRFGCGVFIPLKKS